MVDEKANQEVISSIKRLFSGWFNKLNNVSIFWSRRNGWNKSKRHSTRSWPARCEYKFLVENYMYKLISRQFLLSLGKWICRNHCTMISSQVTVLQPEAWRRIQNSLSRYNEDQMRLQAKRQEREELHTISKDSVKHWENTIEVWFFLYLLYVLLLVWIYFMKI